jgi:hypothetical protein
MLNWKVEKLLSGATITSKEAGNSMLPILKSRQPVVLEPTDWTKVKVGDIVFAKCKGNLYTHLVKATDPKRGVMIGNNHGGINGWTKQVYGIATFKEVDGEMIKI